MLEREERVFLCRPEEWQVAEMILEEARQFGGDVSNLRYQSPLPQEEPFGLGRMYSLRDQGLWDLRQAARGAVLTANGANIEEFFYPHTMRKTVLGTDDCFSFLIWRNRCGKVIAQGERDLLIDNPVVQKMLALRETGRAWEAILCWDLGLTEWNLSESNQHFERVQSKNGTFLFSDEIRELQSKKQVLTYDYHSIYEEAFEGYLIDGDPEAKWAPLASDSKQPTLYRIRTYLFD